MRFGEEQEGEKEGEEDEKLSASSPSSSSFLLLLLLLLSFPFSAAAASTASATSLPLGLLVAPYLSSPATGEPKPPAQCLRSWCLLPVRGERDSRAQPLWGFAASSLHLVTARGGRGGSAAEPAAARAWATALRAAPPATGERGRGPSRVPLLRKGRWFRVSLGSPSPSLSLPVSPSPLSPPLPPKEE